MMEDLKAEKKDVVRREILSYLKVIVFSVAAAIVINHTLIVNAEIPTGSMESTVPVGSRIIINRLSYVLSAPHRGDIISFYYPDDQETEYLKRVIALPGETVEGRNGSVYIDGEELQEEYIKEQFKEDFGPYEVPEKAYFVMGDNRNNSWDSRFWNQKFVYEDQIIGEAKIEYYPEVKVF